MINHMRCLCGRRHKVAHDRRIGTNLQYGPECQHYKPKEGNKVWQSRNSERKRKAK